MEIRELRIGNIVNPISRNSEIHLPIKNVFWKIQSISESSVGVYSIDLPNYEQVPLVESVRNISPVELTPDILEAAGFTKYDWQDAFFIRTVWGHLYIHFFRGRIITRLCNVTQDGKGQKITESYKFGKSDSLEIKYLHTLQNWVHLITGQELQIDLQKLNK